MASELPEHLREVDPDEFGIKRKKWGKGYRYLNGNDQDVEDDEILEIVKNIPVPNTWSEVTLSHNNDTHILARGYDGSGKLQYLYHPDYLEYRNEAKFSHLVEFGLSLPRIRRRLRKDLNTEHWDEAKLLALIVKILDKYHLRIGSRIYAKKNHSFGLTTLRKKHFREVDNAIEFNFTGKSGQQQKVSLTDHTLVKLLEEVAEFPGWELFSFRTDEGQISANGAKVNAYIREISGGDFSARDFRTWAGTVLSVKYLEKAREIVAKNPKRKLAATLVELVSNKLGNTPAICRGYYIHPTVLENVLQADFDCEPCTEKFIKNSLYRKHECRTLEILSKP